jgi:hypothetical protein
MPRELLNHRGAKHRRLRAPPEAVDDEMAANPAGAG